VKGGRAGGGAALTDEGRQVLALYREIADLAARTFEPRMRPPKRRRRSA